MRRALLLSAALPVAAAMAFPAAAQDEQAAAEGETIFQQVCAQCHTLEEGVNRLGPHLSGIVGREAAAVEVFNYSEAMEQSNLVWTPETIEAFIADPQEFIPGNRMPFTGMPDEEQRAAVVAFLQQQSGTGSDSDAGTEGEAPVGSPTPQEEGQMGEDPGDSQESGTGDDGGGSETEGLVVPGETPGE